MKHVTSDILKKYARMSGDKKVRIGLDLSRMVRKVRKAGSIATGDNTWKSTKPSFLK